MGKFITTLKVEQVSEATGSKNALWRITEPLIYESDKLGMIIVDRGTLTDFASVPRLPITYLLAGGKSNAPGVLHDNLYGTHNTGRDREVSRLQSDNIIFEAILDAYSPEGYSIKSILMRRFVYLLAGATWLGVRLFGWRFWKGPQT